MSGGEVGLGEAAGAEEAGEFGGEEWGGDGDFWGVGAAGKMFEPGAGLGEALGGDFGEAAVEGVGGEGLEERLEALGGLEGGTGAADLLEDPNMADEGAEDSGKGRGGRAQSIGEEGVEEGGGLGEVPGLGEGDAEFGTDFAAAGEGGRGMGVVPFGLEEGEVARDFGGHGLWEVAVVVEGDVEGLERGPGAALVFEPIGRVLVDAALEAEEGVVAKEAGGGPGGVVGAEAVLEGGGGRGGVEEAEEAAEFSWGEGVVSVENEDPRFGDMGDAGVASSGEVVGPGEVAQVGAVALGDVAGAVLGAGVGEVDGGEAFEALQAGLEGGLPVLHDHADGEGGAHVAGRRPLNWL